MQYGTVGAGYVLQWIRLECWKVDFFNETIATFEIGLKLAFIPIRMAMSTRRWRELSQNKLSDKQKHVNKPAEAYRLQKKKKSWDPCFCR